MLLNFNVFLEALSILWNISIALKLDICDLLTRKSSIPKYGSDLCQLDSDVCIQ